MCSLLWSAKPAAAAAAAAEHHMGFHSGAWGCHASAPARPATTPATAPARPTTSPTAAPAEHVPGAELGLGGARGFDAPPAFADGAAIAAEGGDVH